MTVHLYRGDIPDDLDFGGAVAVDTETMGLRPARDRLCLVQLSSGDGDAHLVQIPRGGYEAPNLTKILGDRDILKIFHFARFDIAILRAYLGISCQPVYCTRTASRLVRTYTDKHGLRECCKELLGVEISKQQQSSDWGAENLSEEQLTYAANDVLHLHALKGQLDEMLEREGRADLARKCFDFLPARAGLDLLGWQDTDIFDHC
ncbi:MAG: ribonuclease D [Alphaproteobacteria bacterium]|nr:ribonuclease D [Alphaproteobacteria bacterium]